MTGPLPREPARLDELLTTIAGGSGNPPARALRLALHGQNAPLTAQLAFQLLHALPRDIAAHPGSAAFREATRTLFGGMPVYLEPTRRDNQSGVRWLLDRDLLPDWVRLSPEGN
jgi:hypothetical protein